MMFTSQVPIVLGMMFTGSSSTHVPNAFMHSASPVRKALLRGGFRPNPVTAVRGVTGRLGRQGMVMLALKSPKERSFLLKLESPGHPGRTGASGRAGSGRAGPRRGAGWVFWNKGRVRSCGLVSFAPNWVNHG